MSWYKDLFIVKYFQQRPTISQFIKFSFVGAFNVFVDLIVYIFFTRLVHWHYLLAATLSFLVAATSSFLLNKYWTFQVKSKGFQVEYIKFIIVASGGLLWTVVFLWILVDKFDWYDIIAKIATLIIVVNWNFWLQKHWTFKSK